MDSLREEISENLIKKLSKNLNFLNSLNSLNLKLVNC